MSACILSGFAKKKKYVGTVYACDGSDLPATDDRGTSQVSGPYETTPTLPATEVTYTIIGKTQCGDDIRRITTKTYSSLNRTKVDYAVGSNPYGIAFDSVTSSVWVTNLVSNTVSKVNILTGAKVDYAVGSSPYGIAFDSATNSIWVTNYSSNTVSKVNILTGANVDYAVGSSPYGIAFDSATNSIWVTNYSSNTVSKLGLYGSGYTLIISEVWTFDLV